LHLLFSTSLATGVWRIEGKNNMNYQKSKWREEKDLREVDDKVTWFNVAFVLVAWVIVAYLIYRTMI
jgi:preprotein translocase subunit Sec63